MARRPAKRPAEPAPQPAPGDTRVPVVIRAGHTHRGVHYAVDTSYQAMPAEAERLRQFNALAGGG